MPTQPMTKSLGSEKSRPSRGPMYFSTFGKGVDPDLGKFASNTGQVELLHKLLQDQIDKGEPVRNWEEFAKPLVEAYKARH